MDEFKLSCQTHPKSKFGPGGPKCPCCGPVASKQQQRRLARRALKRQVEKLFKEIQ